jgi:hypothetical protein
MVRYIDDFVLCFQFRSDALRVQEALAKRLSRFSLTLEPTKTKLVEFGRFAHRQASKRGRKRPEPEVGDCLRPPSGRRGDSPPIPIGVPRII